MFKRQLADFGIHPVAGQFILFLLCTGGVYILFRRLEYAAYLITLGGIYTFTLLAEPRRNGLIKTIFSTKKYNRLRRMENVLAVLPFAGVLLYYRYIMLPGLLIMLSILLSGITVHNRFAYKVNTPFSRHPFEFTLGYRNTYIGIGIAYFLTLMSIKSGNFNLGVFSLLLVVVICMSYYIELEDDFYIWIHSNQSTAFLLKKFWIAMKNCTLLCVPVGISLAITYPEHINVVLIALVLGLLYLAVIVFGKYASFPYQASIPQAVLLGICIFFPPLLLVILPYFYTRASRRLKTILQ